MGNHTLVAKQLAPNPNNYNGTTPSSWSTGKDYWKYQQLDRANKLYAKLMNGRKYEDKHLARSK